MGPMLPRRATKKRLSALAAEWDKVVEERLLLRKRHSDLSFTYVLAPTVRKLAGLQTNDRVLDVGCGAGELTILLRQHCQDITGVDVSRHSIKMALKRAKSRVTFVASSVEQFARKHVSQSFDVVIANMVLQDAPRLNACVAAAAKLLRINGRMVVTITHPCFWPSYAGYLGKDWFTYNGEIPIEAWHTTSLSPHKLGVTTHFHRPLARYFHAFWKAGLDISALEEPMPSKAILARYPRPWGFPRFLAVQLQKRRND